MSLADFEVYGQWTNNDTDSFVMVCAICRGDYEPGWHQNAKVYDGYDAPATLAELIAVAESHVHVGPPPAT